MLGNISSLILIIAGALTSIAAHSLFRLGLQKTGLESLNLQYVFSNLFRVVFQPFIFAGFLLFGVAAIIWLRILTIEPLNKGYPLLMAFSMLFLVFSSIFLLREPLTLTRIAGMAIIVLGAFLVFAKIS